jgi:agmatine deiminase
MVMTQEDVMQEGTTHGQRYTMPAEWESHEGTWLQWPHENIYKGHQLNLERTWLTMVYYLHQHENVHIIVCDERHRDHVEYQLKYFGIRLQNIDFYIIETNDVWARDNGPVFVLEGDGSLAITDWNFNGWGNRFEHQLDKQVPSIMGDMLSIPVLNPSVVLEGGAVEVNGKGTFMATQSSIVNPNRNPGISQEEVERIISQYLGVSHFIWLSGASKEEGDRWGSVTDSHIDGAARFTDESTVLYNWTDDRSDPHYPVLKRHYDGLREATTESGKPLTLVSLPLPKNGVHRISSMQGAKSSLTIAIYCNYYVANGVVLVPVYGNEFDHRAKAIISEQFPDREVVGIDAVSLVELGGVIHCVTQQQPAATGME